MASKSATGPAIKDLDFMVSNENSWADLDSPYKSVFWHRSVSDIDALIEDEFPEEFAAPLATFKQDFSGDSWKNSADLSEITKHVSDWAKYLADPDEPSYLEIPFSESFRESIRLQIQMDAGLDLIRSSRAMRDYFRYWSNYQEAVLAENSLVRPNINANWNYGCSGLLALGIFSFIATGIQTANMGGASFFIILFGAGIFWLLRSGKRSVEKRLSDFDEKVESATSRLAKAQKKLIGFLDRNPWFVNAVEEVEYAAIAASEKFIVEQEAILAKRREEEKYIDSSMQNMQVGARSTDGAQKNVPKKMERFSPRDYEIFCAGWVEHLGGQNVRVTQQSSDGGIDIISDNEVAQVKLHGTPVSVQPIRELFGVAQSLSKTPLFFTSTGYTQAAITFAEANDIFLFIADPVKEDLRGITEISRALKRTGLTLNLSSDGSSLDVGTTEGNAHSGTGGYEDGVASDGYPNR